jgi:NAD(P)-dependent dehydrogenase (short-subunit alcohol dehydrogenase family)
MTSGPAGSSPSNASLAGRTALVTGGGRGAGAAIAARLAAHGAAVIVAARTREEVDRVAAALRGTGAHANAATCDVSSEESVAELAAYARQTYGRIDILVNNAGVAMAAPLVRTSLADWRRMLDVNATGAFLCMKAFLPAMLDARWGRVVNVASTAAVSADRYIAAYAASKHALVGLTRAAAAETAAQGVTVNAVCPGFLNTDMTAQSIARVAAATGRTSEQALETIASRNPQKRLIDPEEVAAAVAYLCTDAAQSINGTSMVLDGGELRR